MLLEMDLTYER